MSTSNSSRSQLPQPILSLGTGPAAILSHIRDEGLVPAEQPQSRGWWHQRALWWRTAESQHWCKLTVRLISVFILVRVPPRAWGCPDSIPNRRPCPAALLSPSAFHHVRILHPLRCSDGNAARSSPHSVCLLPSSSKLGAPRSKAAYGPVKAHCR